MRFAIVLFVFAMVVYASACTGGCGKSNGLLGGGILNGGILNGGILNKGGSQGRPSNSGSGSRRGCSNCGGNIDNVSTTTSG